jgi:hypothetical protein
MIHLFIAIGLTPGGSNTVHSTVHIYIQTYHIQNYKKCNQQNMKECDKRKSIKAANFIWSIYLLIMLDTLLLRPSLHFTTFVDTSILLIQISPNYTSLHYTCRQFTSSHLNFTQLHFTSSHLNFTNVWFVKCTNMFRPYKLYITLDVFVVDACAELVHIMWVSQNYGIMNTHMRKTASVWFGSQYDTS